jgi:hypothetical protein
MAKRLFLPLNFAAKAAIVAISGETGTERTNIRTGIRAARFMTGRPFNSIRGVKTLALPDEFG